MIYEVLWTRQVTLLIGHTTAAASTVLAASSTASRSAPQSVGGSRRGISERRALQVLGVVEIGIAAAAALDPALFEPRAGAPVDDLRRRLRGVTRADARRRESARVTLPGRRDGRDLPLAARWICASVDAAGAKAGDLYASNPVGAAAGTALAWFVSCPALGLRGTFGVAAALNVVAALGAWGIAQGDTAKPARQSSGRSPAGTARRPAPANG